MKKNLLFFILLFFVSRIGAQTCTALGQTPATAFPVCGTTVFEQENVPVCSSNSLYVPGCSGAGSADYENKNPYWYKFTCYTSGTLGFMITPKDLTDDYDWQLYDVTGLDPDQVFTNTQIIVTGNWAGNPGTTGTSASGVGFIQCASSYDGTESRFARMPNIIAGHDYILLVSHFTNSQSGYGLSFSGGTAVITDPKAPELKSLESSCDATRIYIKLNKNMKCSSLAVDGSDFSISDPGIKVISASAFCTGFDMDSLVIGLDKPLPVGNYTITVKNGTDGNTLFDNCGTNIPVGNSLPLIIAPILPTPMDSLSPVQCAPQLLQLVFRKNILCSSVAPDGSDFVVTGPSPVPITSATVDCKDGFSRIITLNLSEPMVHGGSYQILLKDGNDGNTIFDECAQETPAGSSLRFGIKDTVSAAFTYHLIQGCKTDTIQFLHNGANGVDEWNWQLDYNGTTFLQNPITYFDPYGEKNIILRVSNGFCSDTVSRIISLGNRLKAAFSADTIICPEDSVVFINQSEGDIISYLWNFQDGTSSVDPNPGPKKYPLSSTGQLLPVSLIVHNSIGCSDTAVTTINVLPSCYIAVPNAFTPNRDGLNDYLYPLNAFKADNLDFKVYNRAGQLIFESKDWTQKWDGTFKGEPQDAGVFVWTLQYDLPDTGKHFFLKGSAVLIR
ncbi:MAG: gliding motility-associated C-terminal domain-containing protein [Ginsengibacter sp.]